MDTSSWRGTVKQEDNSAIECDKYNNYIKLRQITVYFGKGVVLM
jgi:hypothetical protein